MSESESVFHARAHELRKQGLGYKRIAAELGTSPTTVRRIVTPGAAERLRASSRAAKQRRTGICERCGGETRYAGHGQDVSRLCFACGAATNGERAALRIGTGSAQQALRAVLISRGDVRFMEIVGALGWQPSGAAARLNRYLNLGLIERPARGLYRWIAE